MPDDRIAHASACHRLMDKPLIIQSDRFYWLHIPTGKRGQSEFTRTHEGEMLNRHLKNEYQLINAWNRQGQGLWQYWI